jgi:hypothetical protein
VRFDTVANDRFNDAFYRVLGWSRRDAPDNVTTDTVQLDEPDAAGFPLLFSMYPADIDLTPVK